MATYSKEKLRAFEQSIKAAFEGGVKGALHLSHGNEDQLIEIFKGIKREDWVFSTWRSHYHALLHGCSPTWLRNEILSGRSISINSRLHNFFSSSIVGGILPIATGKALAIKRRGRPERVWCFVGDMTASCGMFHDCLNYATGFDLPITFVVEDNGMSTNTPTEAVWGNGSGNKVLRYAYKRGLPHSGVKER